jgi:hypothetical protein
MIRVSGIGFVLVSMPRAVATVVWAGGAVRVKGDQPVEASVSKQRSKYEPAAQLSHQGTYSSDQNTRRARRGCQRRGVAFRWRMGDIWNSKSPLSGWGWGFARER